MQLTNLTTTHNDPAQAWGELAQKLAAISISPSDIDEFMVKAAVHSADKLAIWGDQVNRNTGSSYDGMDSYLKNSLINRGVRTCRDVIVASSLLASHDRLGACHARDVVQECSGDEAVLYLTPQFDGRIWCMGMSDKREASEYKNSFDFMSFTAREKGEYAQYVAMPCQLLDYRICAALSESGLLEKFSEKLAHFVGEVGHDFVHTALKSNESSIIDEGTRRVNRLNPRGTSLSYEELWALMTHSSIYEEIKSHGYAKQIAHDARELLDMVKQFEGASTRPQAETQAMSASLKELVAFHLSNFIERGQVEKAIRKDFSEEQLENMLLSKKPGNSVGERIPFKDLGKDRYIKGRENIHQLSAHCFDKIDKVFDADYQSLHPALERLRSTIEARLDYAQVEGVTHGKERDAVRQRGERS